jgi:Kef-type K+ transport system membrane component KefB
MLVITGMLLRYFFSHYHITIPDLSGLLPFMGTLGLILIVLEGSLDLSISRDKRALIRSSVSSAVFLFVLFELIFAVILILFMGIPAKTALLNTIPLGIISSAIAIPSVSGYKARDREFVIYESSFSDIFGILVFDFILFNNTSPVKAILGNMGMVILTIVVSILVSAGLALILHKISRHVKCVIITTVIILVYALAKMAHMPSLLVVLIFGLVLNNNHLFNNKVFIKFINFEALDRELHAFKNITCELTFVVRSFFFIMFGYYTSVNDLLNINNLFISLSISFSVFLIRFLYFRFILKSLASPLIFVAPRGLITILLFLSIPVNMALSFINEGVVTQTIFLTVLVMTFGNVFFGRTSLKT